MLSIMLLVIYEAGSKFSAFLDLKSRPWVVNLIGAPTQLSQIIATFRDWLAKKLLKKIADGLQIVSKKVDWLRPILN